MGKENNVEVIHLTVSHVFKRMKRMHSCCMDPFRSLPSVRDSLRAQRLAPDLGVVGGFCSLAKLLCYIL
jgi:hypothetical protein